MAWLFLGESITWWHVLGGISIIGGVLLILHDRKLEAERDMHQCEMDITLNQINMAPPLTVSMGDIIAVSDVDFTAPTRLNDVISSNSLIMNNDFELCVGAEIHSIAEFYMNCDGHLVSYAISDGVSSLRDSRSLHI